MPVGVPPEQWTPEYAAQVLQILQQSQEQNPYAPPMTSGGIVPMGAPGSLTPPVTNEMPDNVSLPPSPPVQPGGSQGGLMGFLGQHGRGLGEALAMGALGFLGGMQPGQLGAQNIQTVVGLSARQREEAAARQAMQLEAEARQVLQAQGPEAARKFLVEKAKTSRIDPRGMRIVQERIERVEKGEIASRAAGMMLGSNPELQDEGMRLAFKSLDPKEAIDLVKAARLEKKLYTVGNNLVDANGQTIFKAPKDKKISDLGTGQDVNQEIAKLWPEGIDDFLGKLEKGDPSAVAAHRQAVVNAQQREDTDKAAGRAARMGEMELMGRAMSSGIGGALGRLMGSAQEQSTRDKLAQMDETLTGLQNVKASYDKAYVGPVEGRTAWLKEKTGKLTRQQSFFRASLTDMQDLIKRLRTGAAINAQEEDTYLRMLPNETDNEESFWGKYDRVNSALRAKRKAYSATSRTPAMNLEDDPEPRPTYQGSGQAPGQSSQEGWTTDPKSGIKYRIKR